MKFFKFELDSMIVSPSSTRVQIFISMRSAGAYPQIGEILTIL